MRSGCVFFKKEIKAILRTYRIWVIPLIFIFFGVLSPVTAKFTPALVKAAIQADKTQQQIFGQIKIPEPTAVDAYGQWFKNLSQFGILALILTSMGLISEEKTRGTLALVVTKPIARTSIVVSKFLSQTGLLAASGAMGLGACYLYTILLFDKAPFRPIALSTLAFAAFALLVLSITIFFSALLKHQMGAGGLALLSVFALSILASLGRGLEKYSPGALPGMALKIATGSQAFSKTYPAIAISIAASVVMIAAAAYVLEHQEI
ncbi:MAG: ABC transporter permease [Actinobacteria bacterium]|nr:ABC transporter permease [Actinomycetota bacterium]